MSRVPIRLRLSFGFALGMGLLLVIVGLFFYGQLRNGIDRTIDRELSARLAGAIAIVRDDGDDLGDPTRDPLVRVDPGGYVQVLGPGGRVVSATSAGLAESPLVRGDEDVASDLRSGRGSVPTRDVFVPGIGSRLRVAAAVARDDGVDYTVVAGASMEQRDEALSDLRKLLWIGGPILLLLSGLAGYLLAAAALRPVERMRERAASLSGRSVSERLPVNPANDEIARLGKTLNEMLERIEVAFERERGFAADASHELRTPLTILRAELDLARMPGRDREEMSAAVVSAMEETDRLIALADDLLELARTESGEIRLEGRPVATDSVVFPVIDRFGASAAERGVEVRSKIEGEFLYADPARLDQALSNLLANAVDHAEGRVDVSVRKVGGATVIHVLDDGPGFSDQMLGSGARRFARDRSRSGSGGTGLGLAITDAIASAHGGRLTLSNRPEGGADVAIELPDQPL